MGLHTRWILLVKVTLLVCDMICSAHDHVATFLLPRQLLRVPGLCTTSRIEFHDCRRCCQISGHRDLEGQPTANDIPNYWKLPRLFVGSSRMASGSIITLSLEQTHYLTKVMRFFKKRKANYDDLSSTTDCVRLFNGLDGEWLAKVIPPSQPELNGKKHRFRQRYDVPLEAECFLKLRKQVDNKDKPWILLVPLKNQSRMKLMIEKCTELGVGAIVLVESDHMDGTIFSRISSESNDFEESDDHFNGVKRTSRQAGVSIEKLESQAIEASEQSEQMSIPYITTDLSSIDGIDLKGQSILSVKQIIEGWCSNWDQNHENEKEPRKLLVCRERSEEVSDNILPVLSALNENKRVAFLVGPEGGWSREEEIMFDEICEQYENQNSPIQCVSLGSSVLRAETACIMAIGAWALVHY